MNVFTHEVAAARNVTELEAAVHRAIAGTDFMEFARFNLGEILRKTHGPGIPRILRLVIGNPLVMRLMAVHVHDAASYAPVTILIDERPDGVHLSYDRMASYIADYGSDEAVVVARDLDAKVEALLATAAT